MTFCTLLEWYAFVKTHRMYDTKREPEYKLWTLVNNHVSILVH